MGDASNDALADDEKSSEIGSTDSSSWNNAQEDLMKSISERSNCMRWLHTQCNIYFENTNFYLTIPNVVISTLNGGFTMSLTALFPDINSQRAATTVIGIISIFSAMLITMNQYIKSQQMMESHRAAALSYSKLYRMISNELALRRDQRTNALDFLKHVRQEQDRLENTSPSILPHIITYFNVQFRDKHIEKPEITGDLDVVEVNTKNRKGKEYSPKEADSPQNSSDNTPSSIVKIISSIRSPFKKSLDSRMRTPSLGPTTPLNVPSTSLNSIDVVPKN
jgi:hypothetical protein